MNRRQDESKVCSQNLCRGAKEENKRSAVKKLLFIALGVVLMTAPASVKSQDFGAESTGIIISKVNEDKLRGDIAKSDAEIADPKKNVKSATWIKRGNTFVAVDARPLNGLYKDLDEATLKLSIPPASTSESKTIDGVPYTVYHSGQADIYVSGGYVTLYTPSIVIDSAALDKAYEAYDKAFAMDPKAAKKVAKGMEDVRVKSNENGEFAFRLTDYAAAAANFHRAYKISSYPALAKLDTLALFNAGWSELYGNDFTAAVADLDSVITLGFGGHLNGLPYVLKSRAQALSGDMKTALETAKYAIGLYPGNEDLLNTVLDLYARNNEDSSSLIPIVQAAIENNPKNITLYIGLAQIYNKLDDYDNAITTIKKALELDPKNVYANTYMGDYIIGKGDAMAREIGMKATMASTSAAQIKQAQADVDAMYAQAVACYEAALPSTTNKSDKRVVLEQLKMITFKLREDPAMNAKYDQYNKMFNEL